MSNTHRIKLALRIIGDQFGDIVRDVATVLTEGDKCTLPHLFRTVNSNIAARASIAAAGNAITTSQEKKGISVDGTTVRTALMILHQHNLLLVSPPRSVENISDNPQVKPVVQTGFLYSLNITNVLHRLNFARMLSIVRSKYGELAMYVAEAVMLHGKMRLDQIQEQVVFERNAAADADHSSGGVSMQEVQTAFETLVSNRFIVTVALTDKGLKPVLDAKNPSSSSSSTGKRPLSVGPEPAAKRGRGAARPTAAATAATSGRRPAAAKLAPEASDDGIPVELRMMLGDTALVGAAAKKGTDTGAAQSLVKDEAESELGPRGGRAPTRGGRGGAGRGNAAFAASAASQHSSTNGASASLPLWMIGWDQFLREARHAACVQVVTLLHEAMAGSIIRIMLALTMSTEKGFNQNKSGEVSVASIHAQLEREYHAANGSSSAPAGTGRGFKPKAPTPAVNGTAAPAVRLDLMSLKRLLEYLRLSESSAVVKVVGSESEVGGPSYMVNMDGLIATLQRRTIFSIASERFGFVSARIIELLQRHQYLEQQQVCDMALLPARETRERLYKLFLDKWINYIDLSKRADFNPSTSYYFWFLDLPQLRATLREHSYQTLFNLTIRRAAEAEKGRELLDREDCIDNEADRVRHSQLMHKLNKADLALLQVQASVLLMEHF